MLGLVRRPFVLLVLALLLALANAWHFHHTADDAFISFRYARNLATGNGLTFNVGERVMGYSDLLWVLLLALLDKVGIEPPVGGRLLGTLFAWLTLFLLDRHLRKHLALFPVGVALFFLAANATFTIWMFAGLEGQLFGCLLTHAVVTTLDEGEGWKIGVSLGLLSMTRPEGFLFIVPVCAVLALKKKQKMAGLVGAIALAITGLVMAWQWSYYGSPLPNTYYAKAVPLNLATIQRAYFYGKNFVSAYYGMPVVLPILWMLVTPRTRAARGLLPFLVLGAFTVFWFRIGGDALTFHRLWVPMLPMLALLAAETVHELGAKRSRHLARMAPVVGALCLLASAPASVSGPDLEALRGDDDTLKSLVLISKKLKELPKGTVLAANIVGIPTYYSELRLIDMLGLTDSHIARSSSKRLGIPGHESHDGAYVLSQKPDIILPNYPITWPNSVKESDITAVGYPSDRDLYETPAFFEQYHFLALPVGARGYVALFIRNDFKVNLDLLFVQ